MTADRYLMMRLTLEVAVDKDAAARLAGYAGSSYSPPEAGIDLEAASLLADLVAAALEHLERLDLKPELADCSATVTGPPRSGTTEEPF